MRSYQMLGLAVLTTLLAQARAQQSPPLVLIRQRSADVRAEDAEQGIQLGTPVEAVNPVVPDEFGDKRAVAVLRATIRTDGSFDNLSALAGDKKFEESSIDALRQWHYTPATLKGDPVEVKVFVMIDSNGGNVHTHMEPDLPFPTQPRDPLDQQIARGDVFRVIPGQITPPKATYQPDPEYSEPARFAIYQGNCVLSLIVGADGNTIDVWVTQKLGLGLDNKAVEAVRQWKFQPATKDGQPVPVLLNAEVQFRLY